VTRGFASGLVLLALAAAPAQDARESAKGKPRLELSEARRDGGRVAVSFRLANVLDEEALEQMRSGVPVVYRHRLEVLGRRRVFWPSKEHASMRIVTSAVYDSLTQRYELLRTIEPGKRRDRGRPPLEERTQTESIEKVRAWMTEFDQLPALELPGTARDVPLRVRVHSTLGRHYVLFLIPTRIDVSAERRLEP